MTEANLFLVPTPIGNLGDITLRALEVLKDVDVILAEDTRTSGFLLKHFNITTSLESFHAHNEHKKLESVIERLKKGVKMALITDAGTPGISDPGFLLVREALNREIRIDVLPGATAFLPALIKSGFPTDRFVYEGFLPQKKGRKTRIEGIASESRTTVLYESPYRVIKFLEELMEMVGPDRMVSLSREITKKFEETITGDISSVLTDLRSRSSLKGEFVIVVSGNES